MTNDTTFIMPAYNAGKYIREAIDSVLSQTVRDWRLIIVDDCSSDDTRSIAEHYAASDSRISVIRPDSPSGSAFTPRQIGISRAQTSIVAPIDADDRIPPDYLESLLSAKEKYGADAVYPTMYEWEGSTCRQMIDLGNPDYNLKGREQLLKEYKALLFSPCPGKDFVKLTIDGWIVNCNGGLIDKSVYLKAFEAFKFNPSSANADEVLTRLILLNSRCVVFSDAKYYYRSNPDSITRSYSPKRFDLLDAYIEVMEMMKQNFGIDSEEYMLAQRHLFHLCIYYLQLINNDFPHSERRYGISRVKQTLKQIDFKSLRPYVRSRQWRLMQLPAETSILLIGINDGAKRLTDNLKGIAKSFMKRPMATLRHQISSRKEIWKYSGEVKALKHGALAPGSESESYFQEHYKGSSDATCRPSYSAPKVVICPFDGTILHGGLTDRLRGILSTYYETRRRGIPFKICWHTPFNLDDYLLPAGKVDWRLSPEDMSRDASEATPVVIQDVAPNVARQLTRAAIDGLPGTLHIYSNSDAMTGHYKELFNELFRPSPRLQKAVDHHLALLGERYISFTFRFLGLLGDFKDTIGAPLEPPAAEALMKEALDEMLRLTRQYPEGYPVHVTSDSELFLKYVAGAVPGIYTVPGIVRNIDLQRGDYDEAWLKTFVDQQLLMNADVVYRMRTQEMFPTGFPKFAAEVGGVKFIDHAF